MSSYGPSPVPELETLLTRMQERLDKARESVHPKQPTETTAAEDDESSKTTTTPTTKTSGGLFSGFRSLRSAGRKTETKEKSGNDEAASSSSQQQPSSSSPSSLNNAARPKPIIRIQRKLASGVAAGGGGGATVEKEYSEARFVQLGRRAEEEFVEDLRRVAELVVLGENYVTSQEKKQQRAVQLEKKKWKEERDSCDGMSSDNDDDDDDDEAALADEKLDPEQQEAEEAEQQSPEYAHLFDLFFERNGLEMIVNMLTGVAFEQPEDDANTSTESTAAPGDAAVDEPNADPTPSQQQEQESLPILYLPSLEIATQALQSVSILVQNVSRATSLYIILSNDHMNTLIRLPMSMYEAAERRRREEELGLDESRTKGVFNSPELAEFSTHFVTLLKSLAMRMNAETLQFFLKYPTETIGGGAISSAHLSSSEFTPSPTKNDNADDDDGEIPMMSSASKTAGPTAQPQHAHTQVEFPLYERALEFCAAHQDSFVRITAMNICLNTLRLTTVSPPDDDKDNDSNDECEIDIIDQSFSKGGSSPDGVLHNAQPLPFRERLAIAQHTCTPSRVERLIAPIFTKLSERWSSLDESIREIDSNKDSGSDIANSSISSNQHKVAMAKEKVRRERLVRGFKDRSADLQDELLLLEDVFKVGLTVLNEQLIEMMLATFVYPMLLQPLIIFHQRFTSAVDPSQNAYTDNPFGGYGADYGHVEEILAPVAGPAKTSLFTLASCFQFLSNPPLLRLLYTALFHPLSPDSTSVPTVRSTLEVATVDRLGRETIRVDQNVGHDGPIANERSTYDFGTTCNNRRSSKASIPDIRALEETEVCVFVLAPALAEVLEFRGQNLELMTRTRPNSYRKSFLQCLNVPHEMSEVRALAVCTIDAALSAFESKFAADIIFGTELRTFADDIPLDERNLDSENAHRYDDRGLGDSGPSESRFSIRGEKGGPVGSDPTGEVISALCGATLFATRSGSSEWKLVFDMFASHALLSAARGNGRALVSAAKHFETLWRQASTFVSEQPSLMLNDSPMGGSSSAIPGSPTVNANDYDEQMHGMIMNMIFFGSDGDNGTSDVLQLVKLRGTASQLEQEGYSTTITDLSSFDGMSDRVGKSLLDSAAEETVNDDNGTIRDLQRACECAIAFLKADALISFLKDLASTGGLALLNINLAGVALSATGAFVQTMDWKLSKKVWAPISSNLANTLFEPGHVENIPEGGSVVHLAGFPAIPCVCEAPASLAHLFYGETTGVVAEGVTWQSLYLVFRDGYLLFAQPIPGGEGGDGRIVAACPLERLEVDRDAMSPEEETGSPAKRLLLTYKWFDMDAPPLFLFDEMPQQSEVGPFHRVEYFASRLDVWFENGRAADYAFHTMTAHVFSAKSQRGRRVQEYLAPRTVIQNHSDSFEGGY